MSYKAKDKKDYVLQIDNPWEVQDRESKAMVESALETFSNSSLASEARKGGWYENLYGYARDCAIFQARKIVGCNAIPYSNRVYAWDRIIGDEVKNRVRDFIETNTNQADRGFIEISVPSDAIRYWRENVKKAKVD